LHRNRTNHKCAAAAATATATATTAVAELTDHSICAYLLICMTQQLFKHSFLSVDVDVYTVFHKKLYPLLFRYIFTFTKKNFMKIPLSTQEVLVIMSIK